MTRIDAEARAVEMTNAAIPASESGALARCHELLAAEARASAARAVAAARVPDSYDDALRLLGLYPLTRVPFSWGVAAWQRTTRELFATPLAEVPVLGRRVAYAPATAVPQGPVAGLLPASEAAALRMPDLAPGRAWQLLQAHAPVLVVDTLDDDDRVGALRWQAGDGHPAVTVDPGEPTAYARVAWAVVDDAATLQLVYTFWFPARPATRPLDLLAGRLDALVWRVTLDAEGRALVYDSIHACGCYHMFFPTGRVRERPGPRPDEGGFDETMFSPQAVRSPGPGERVTIFIGARDHYIQRVVVDAKAPVTGATPATGATGVTYHLRDEDRLRTLPLPAATGSGTRSVYGPDGLVPGSERAERFFFWPMGVPSAGQMRQWGHHATAFVGRRHFDDPGLIERYFSLVTGSD